MEYYYTIDIGVNFASKNYKKDTVNSILKTSYDRGVSGVISISNSQKEILINEKLGISENNLYFTVGVHPHDAKSQVTKMNLDKYMNNPKCVAIGECGLDYNRMFSPKDIQKNVFEQQIEIAKKYNKPLYLHCRDAYDDFLTIVKQHGYFHGVIHCFTGNKEQAIEFEKLGFHIGITGFLLNNKRNINVIEAIKHIPVSKLMVETDAPWMSIDRSRKSHPTDTFCIVNKIAEIKKLDETKLGKDIHNNTINFFKLISIKHIS